MPIDPATLHDLDVFSTSTPRGPTLFSLVDRTRSRAGREALRQRLVAPTASAEEGILALQRAHQSLAADATSYRTIFDRTDTDSAERYLNSNWQLPSTRRALTRLVGGILAPEMVPGLLAGRRQRPVSRRVNVASCLRSQQQAFSDECRDPEGIGNKTRGAPFCAGSGAVARPRSPRIHVRPSRVGSAGS